MEGVCVSSRNIKVVTPFAMEELPQTLHYTYLDIAGRPVVTLAAFNLVQHHIQDFVVSLLVYLLHVVMLVHTLKRVFSPLLLVLRTSLSVVSPF